MEPKTWPRDVTGSRKALKMPCPKGRVGSNPTEVNFLERSYMRQFIRMIFLGNGVLSRFETKGLHDRLDDGFDWLCGMQQQCTNEEFKRDEQRIKDVVLDVAAAFGYEIEFKGECIFIPTKNIQNMKEPSDIDLYVIRVFENEKWRDVEYKEYADAIGFKWIEEDVIGNALSLVRAKDA